MRFATVLLFALMLGLTTGAGAVSAQSDAVARGGSAFYPGLDVTIADRSGMASLRLAFEVQCVDERAAEMVASPQAREAVVMFLRDKTATELATPSGKQKLKTELVGVINKAVGGPRAVRVYFTQFVIF